MYIGLLVDVLFKHDTAVDWQVTN